MVALRPSSHAIQLKCLGEACAACLPQPTRRRGRRRIRASWVGLVDDGLTGWSLLTWLGTIPGRAAWTSDRNLRGSQSLDTYRLQPRRERLRDACAPALDGSGGLQMVTATYFLEKARQCRRLARATNDDRTIKGLTALAQEFEAKAKAAEASSRTVGLLGNGETGSLVPDDKGDPV